MSLRLCDHLLKAFTCFSNNCLRLSNITLSVHLQKQEVRNTHVLSHEIATVALIVKNDWTGSLAKRVVTSNKLYFSSLHGYFQ